MSQNQSFSIANLIGEMKGSPVEYFEFLKVPSLSSGIYHISRNAVDPQEPHQQDEVYHVLSGKATFRTQDGDQSVEPGSILYVPAKAEHKFVDISEDLTLLVFFAGS